VSYAAAHKLSPHVESTAWATDSQSPRGLGGKLPNPLEITIEVERSESAGRRGRRSCLSSAQCRWCPCRRNRRRLSARYFNDGSTSSNANSTRGSEHSRT